METIDELSNYFPLKVDVYDKSEFSALLSNIQSGTLGEATTSLNPGTPTRTVTYYGKPGTYANFKDASNNPITIPATSGGVTVLFGYMYWNLTSWALTTVGVDMSAKANTSDIPALSIVGSPQYYNIQNPANILTNSYVQSSSGNIITLANALVYYCAVSAGTQYTLSGYVWPSSTIGLYIRFENASGSLISFIITNNPSPTTFTTPAGCVKLYYSIYRSDFPQSYANIQLETGAVANTYTPYGTPGGGTANPERLKSVNSKNIGATYIESGAVVLGAVTDPKSPVTKEYMEGKGYGIPDITTSVVRQLQNPANAISGQFINYNNGALVTLAGGIMYYTPVTDGQQYTLSGYHHPNYAGSKPLTIRFEDASNALISYAVLPSDESPYTFTAPTGCTRILYSVYRSDTPQDYSKIMLNAGATAYVYEAYGPAIQSIASINGIPIVPPSTAAITTDVLSLANAEKIIIPGCSYVEGGGIAVKNKNWINKFAELTNYQVINYGVGGDRFVDITDRIRKNSPSFFTTRALGFRDMGIKFATVQNIGNETVERVGVNSDLYLQEIRENVDAIKASGCFPVFATDYFTGNPFVVEVLRRVANSEGSWFHDIGTIGEKILNAWINGSGTPSAQYWGTHPNYRGNSHTANEMTYQWERLPKPGKSIKIFRKRTAWTAATVNALNYDTIAQRARIMAEITVGNRALNDSDEANGWGLMDQCNLAPSYTKSSTYNDEYIELMTGNPVSFTDWAIFDVTLDKIKNIAANIFIKMASAAGAKFWIKNYQNSADWAFPGKNGASVIVKVDKATYNATTVVVGDIYTSTQVLNGSGTSINLLMKGKFYSQATGYIIGLETVSQLGPTTVTPNTAATLTRTSGTGSATIAHLGIDANMTKYSFAFLSNCGKPTGSFEEVTTKATYNATTGYYGITLAAADIVKYQNYDNLKLIVQLSGAFTISDFYLNYSGGIAKQAKKVWFEEKKTYTEKIATGNFATGWDTTGGWVNSNAVLESMTSTYRDYPAIGNGSINHVSLGFDADNVPAAITRTIALTAKAGYRKCAVRVYCRVFPKLYRTDIGETTETTAVRQVTADSYDGGQLCLGIKGANIVNVLRSELYIGWTEKYFEFEIPPYQTTFDMSIYRDPADIIDPTNYKNHTFPLQVYFVSCQVEGE